MAGSNDTQDQSSRIHVGTGPGFEFTNEEVGMLCQHLLRVSESGRRVLATDMLASQFATPATPFKTQDAFTIPWSIFACRWSATTFR